MHCKQAEFGTAHAVGKAGTDQGKRIAFDACRRLPPQRAQSKYEQQPKPRAVPCSLFPDFRPTRPPTIFFIRADNYAVGEGNEAAKANNPRVPIEQNSVSVKIFNVRKNANHVPYCKIEIIEEWRIF
jgi:hypothetical protein